MGHKFRVGGAGVRLPSAGKETIRGKAGMDIKSGAIIEDSLQSGSARANRVGRRSPNAVQQHRKSAIMDEVGIQITNPAANKLKRKVLRGI